MMRNVNLPGLQYNFALYPLIVTFGFTEHHVAYRDGQKWAEFRLKHGI